MFGFINVPQARTCRIIKSVTPEIVQGLYTDNISECNILILTNEDKISLTHVDRWTPPEHIHAELNWMGESPKIILITKNEYQHNIVYRNVLSGIIDSLEKTTHIAAGIFGISINWEHDLQYYNRLELPQLICHPLEFQLHQTYVMNRYFYDEVPEITRIVYQVNAWTEMNESDLSLQAQTHEYCQAILSQLEEDHLYSYSYALRASFRYFKMIRREIDQENLCLLTLGFLLLHSHNNYQQIFLDEIKYHIQALIETEVSPHAQIEVLAQILESTRDDFQKLLSPQNLQQLSLISESNRKSIIGTYKLMYRFYKHSQTETSEAPAPSQKAPGKSSL